jgi:hypothetical protein
MAAGNQGVDQLYGWNEINHKVRYTHAQANCYEAIMNTTSKITVIKKFI